jgi:hypothetical protein
MSYDHSAQEAHAILIIDGKIVTVTPPGSGYGELNLKWVKGKITTHTKTETTRYEGEKK